MILELVSIIVEPMKLPDWTLSFVIVLLVIGFILAIILSWVYDITPEGMQKTLPTRLEVEKQEGVSRKGPRLVVWISLFVLVAFAIFYISGKVRQSTELYRLEKSIAVLPFENWSPGEEHAYLGNALANEIITELYKVQDFHVISYTSSARYQDPGSLTIPQIAKELGANFIIEGTVERQNDEVSIHVQVIQARDDDHLWANEFNGKWENIFEIQDEIAYHVAEKLKAVLTPEEIREIDEKPTGNTKAYEYYLRGLDIYETNIMDRTGEAMIWFREAIMLDSTFALPWTYLSMCYWRTTPIDSPEYYKIKEANKKALELDPDLNIALVNMAEILDNEYDFYGAEEYILRALEAGPEHYYVLRNAGRFYTLLGRHDLGISYCKKALQNDPTNPTALEYLYRNYFYAGQQLQAWPALKKNTKNGHNAVNYYQLLLEHGHLDSIFQMAPSSPNENVRNFGLAAAHLMAGQQTEADKYLVLLEENKSSNYNYLIALAHAYGNNPDELCNSLERSYEAREIRLAYLKVDPAFEKYRSELKVKAILQKMNYPE